MAHPRATHVRFPSAGVVGGVKAVMEGTVKFIVGERSTRRARARTAAHVLQQIHNHLHKDGEYWDFEKCMKTIWQDDEYLLRDAADDYRYASKRNFDGERYPERSVL